MFVRATKGFTIVELLIVIVVIAILASISVVAYNGIQDRARISSTHTLLSSVKKAMLLYKANTGELPPMGDAWNFDTNPPSCGYPNLIVSELNSGNYANGLSARDAWGRCWGYDDNDCNSGSNAASNLVSAGPNGVYNNGGVDDIVINVTPSC